MKKTTKQRIEIEFRSILSKRDYLRLGKFLKLRAQDLGSDDKNVHFFIMPDKLLKVVNNISRKNAKIVLKLNKIGKGSDFEEIEIPVNPIDADKIVKMFFFLGFNEVQESFQKRHNYKYKEVELALKYSKTWGFHLEMEIVVDAMARKTAAEAKIFKVAEELDVKLMTDKELSDFTGKVDRKYRKPRY